MASIKYSLREELQVSDNTPVNIITYPINLTDACAFVQLIICSKEVSGSERVIAKCYAWISFASSTGSVVISTTDEVTPYKTAGVSGFAYDIKVSGTNIIAEITGVNGVTLEVLAEMQILID